MTTTPHPPADELHTVSACGQRFRVAVRPGDPGRAPLLLCNGIGASLELLTPFVDALAALDGAPPIIRFDVPGIGESPLPRLPYHMTTLAPAVAGLLDALGHERADVLGISWGGGLAQQLAVQRRRRVRRLVLVATGTGSVMVPARPGVLAKLLTPRRHRDPDYARSVAGELYGGSMRADPDRAARLLHAATRTGPKRGYYYQLLAGWGWTSLPLLPWIDRPTLILAGDDDPIVPTANARLMHRLLPRSTLHVYPGGHLALLTEPDPLAQRVHEFLT